MMNKGIAPVGSSKAPATIKTVHRFVQGLKTLEALNRDKDPPRQPVYSGKVAVVRYWFVDASKGGFGSGVTGGQGRTGSSEDQKGTHVRYGTWEAK
mmetsp:Transcript_21378/g.62364  ORF Transcript_21378/g.62364 Transcript_21378/m.62364 type:complete len:96 (+) Transcript_21378:5652-5939(+)